MKDFMIPFPSHLARVGGVTSFLVTYCKYMDRERYRLIDIRNNDIDGLRINRDSASIRIRRKWNYLLHKKNVSSTDAILFFNPSLGKNPIKRFLYLHMNTDIKTEVTFIHGWNKDYEKVIQGDSKLRERFIGCLIKSRVIFVLATEFKNKLVEWGIPDSRIFIENTMVDDELLRDFSVSDIDERSFDKRINLLFLSRIIKEKGVYELIDAYKMVKERFSDVTLTVAGVGPELSGMIKKAKSDGLDIDFPGFVSGERKIEIYRKSDIYLLPSRTEGCPISLLEALSFGIPSIVAAVVGIPDIFEDTKMGYMLDESSPDNLADRLERLIGDEESRRSMSIFNYEHAKDHFLASNVVKRIESRIDNAL